MDNKMMTARANFYRFLSRLYLLEVDEALWNAMQNMTFPVDAAEGDMKAGFELMRGYLDANAEGDLAAVLFWETAAQDFPKQMGRCMEGLGQTPIGLLPL